MCGYKQGTDFIHASSWVHNYKPLHLHYSDIPMELKILHFRSNELLGLKHIACKTVGKMVKITVGIHRAYSAYNNAYNTL